MDDSFGELYQPTILRNVSCIGLICSKFDCGFGISFLIECISITDCEEDEFSNHRSCWKHIAALNTKRKPTEKEFELFKSNAPCFFEECTRRQRSLRRIKCKYLVSKLSKKLKSNTFVDYLE